MVEDPFFLEEEFYAHDRKAQKREKKIAQSKDRSKYKQSNIDQKKKQHKEMPPKDALQGRIVSISKDGILVDADKKLITCTLKGSLKQERTREKNLLAVGDFVFFKKTNNEQGQILSIKERFSYLAREDATRKKQQLIAVNIDQVFIVTSVVEPSLKPHFEENGFCIDTPGIKSFGIWHLTQDEVLQYFSEIAEYSLECKFPNCTHLHEPDCAVLQAVEENRISNLRFESYRSLMSDIQERTNY